METDSPQIRERANTINSDISLEEMAARHNTQLRIERKNTLNTTFGERLRSDEARGLLDWVKTLQKFDDNHVRDLCGTDAAMYLILLRYIANFFGLLSLLSCLNIIIFISGDPIDQDNFRLEHKKAQYSMQALTILNISASGYKVAFAYFYALIFITGAVFSMIIRYLSLF